ncbi:MAG TPA: hypothetical protein VLU25_08030 [Acidobacteriota bacterium]|nr:hypothetical protein [Acidobacteriota bacterium]
MMCIKVLGCVPLLSLLLTPAPAWVQPHKATIPQGTELFVRLGRELDSSKLRAEERFYGEVTVPVTVDDRVVIPPGSQILGRVTLLGEKAGDFRIAVDCETLILPDNRRFQLSAAIQSKEGPLAEESEGEDPIVDAGDVISEGLKAFFGLFEKNVVVFEKDSIITITLGRDMIMSP